MNEANEKLMAEIMSLFAETFPAQAVLKGGMELRLFNCPRYTNDLDYVFVPFKSKKNVEKRIIDALNTLPDATITHSLNSKVLRCVVVRINTKVMVEVTVDTECPSQEMSTQSISAKAGLPQRIIRIMRLDVALSHKVAAFIERRLIRDLYDIYFFVLVMNVSPDKETLLSRLNKLMIREGVKTVKKKMSVTESKKILINTATELTKEKVYREMSDYLDKHELLGLEHKIKIALNKLSDNIL
ncbi:MAG: nucleotidyl transferase AbiEii/AbiGii toxin family protein [Fibrobacteres bacterium]|nr:nucleotidyl transferase AbiEii/AbiGii toxin family protein [Fibrobacterota bacterium]